MDQITPTHTALTVERISDTHARTIAAITSQETGIRVVCMKPRMMGWIPLCGETEDGKIVILPSCFRLNSSALVALNALQEEINEEPAIDWQREDDFR